MKRLSLLIIVVQLFLTTNFFAGTVFTLPSKRGLTIKTINSIYSSNETFSLFNGNSIISGLAITGSISKTSQDYLVRVILLDDEGNEHLILDAYEETNSDSIYYFSNYCDETILLDNVRPDSIKIIVKDALLNIQSISIVPGDLSINKDSQFSEQKRAIKDSQVNDIIERINIYNKKNDKLWKAGHTQISDEPYSVRK